MTHRATVATHRSVFYFIFYLESLIMKSQTNLISFVQTCDAEIINCFKASLLWAGPFIRHRWDIESAQLVKKTSQ